MEGKAPFDVWAHPVETFDLHIPTWRSPRKDASILDHCRAIWSTQANWFRNAINMRTIASKQSFPGVRVKSLWSRDLFRVQSTPWLAPFREIALVSYKQLNQALAAGDDKTIKKLSAVSYQDHLLKVLRTQDLTKKYAWTFHGEKEPCKVVSIRAFPAHMGKEDPTFGSRLLIQALVRFDTLQSLQVYSRKGTLLAGDGKPKHVVEYLVFQKRMWYDTPWVIRDQLFDSLEGKYKMSN
ncbi:hypothetical protein EW026_g2062 [Hermanssonia centrifuga]|uniref:Tim44-like domain-containing protein n=1 Tax=Hermanssonia centrifuga TaxID=98765 RepID=A0A4S4KQ47_9APHY|nr:hypothetical protein EW026_g2062 [Hermanssonia centrifuga]